MSKQLKDHIAQDLKRRFHGLDDYILVDFRGLNSAQSYDLRRTLHGAGVRMNVVPSRLALRVLDRWGGRRAEFGALFRGPTAVVFGSGGAVAASKAVALWKKKNKDLLAIKGGVLGGEIMPPSAVERLARIPDRLQLLAQVVGMVQSPLVRLVGALQGPLRQVAHALEAYRRKLEEGAGSAGGGAPPAQTE